VDAAAAEEYLPPVQLVQAEEPEFEKLPAAQEAQASEPLEPE